MSIQEPQQRPARFFEERVVHNPDVCGNCYRLLFDRVAVPRLIADFRDAAPESIRYVREDTTDEDPHGLFCRCGSDGVTQPDERPRDAATVDEHARNAAETMRQFGFDINESKFVREACRLRVHSDLTGVDMFKEAVRRACKA